MPRLRNPFTDTNLKVLSELAEYRERASKSTQIPINVEKVEKRQAQRDLQALTPEERRALIFSAGAKAFE